MQYLLTEEEYKELVAQAEGKKVANKELIQELCTEVATHKPVKYWGRKEAVIWGCILLDEEHPASAEYCDECPVEKGCPYDYKRWSK